MTRKDIVIRVAEKTSLKQVDVKKVVQATLDYIVDTLVSGQNVELRNFGIFKVQLRKARVGRNPRTGATIPIPERKVVVFKPGREIKQRVK